MGEARRKRDALGEVATELARKMTDEGLLIEAGWVVYERYVVPQEAGEVQRQETKLAFMAGAQHLFASMISIMEAGPDNEPTEADLERMSQIHNELEQWKATLAERMMPSQGQT